jgi:hypothetical protein
MLYSDLDKDPMRRYHPHSKAQKILIGILIRRYVPLRVRNIHHLVKRNNCFYTCWDLLGVFRARSQFFEVIHNGRRIAG